MTILGIIPARYGSTRFPGKPLANILGKSMILRVYEQCKKCSSLSKIIVATDDKKIINHVENFGGKAIMTSKKHLSGTDRCNEVLQKINEKTDIVINIQGDEPFINPAQIDEIIQLFNDPKTEIGTLAKPINDSTIIQNKNTPKVIVDRNRYALNFYREGPISKANNHVYQHIGVYAYRANVLEQICNLPPTYNEMEEQLEQLRWLDNKYKIKVGITNFSSYSVDSPEDIKIIEQKMR